VVFSDRARPPIFLGRLLVVGFFLEPRLESRSDRFLRPPAPPFPLLEIAADIVSPLSGVPSFVFFLGYMTAGWCSFLFSGSLFFSYKNLPPNSAGARYLLPCFLFPDQSAGAVPAPFFSAVTFLCAGGHFHVIKDLPSAQVFPPPSSPSSRA